MSIASFTIPWLETDRLMLRDYRQTDFEDFADFFATDRSRFIGGPLSRELAWRSMALHLGHWALHGYGFWAVEHKATGRFCGHVGLWFPEGWLEPEVGWVMMGHSEGQGIAYEAAIASRLYAYEHLGWKTAVSLIDPGNDRSARLAQRLGCHLEGDFTHDRLGPMKVWRHPSPQDLAKPAPTTFTD